MIITIMVMVNTEGSNINIGDDGGQKLVYTRRMLFEAIEKERRKFLSQLRGLFVSLLSRGWGGKRQFGHLRI